MNKIYKVIWSKARNCYVVVSELAKRNGKCSSSLNKKIIAAFLAAGMTMAATVSVEAVSTVGVASNSTPTNLIKSGNASGANSVAVGDGAFTRTYMAQADAQTMAYDYWQQIIKNDPAFASVASMGSSSVALLQFCVSWPSMVVLPTWRGPATSTAPNMEANSVTVRSACLFMYIKAHPFG